MVDPILNSEPECNYFWISLEEKGFFQAVLRIRIRLDPFLFRLPDLFRPYKKPAKNVRKNIILLAYFFTVIRIIIL